MSSALLSFPNKLKYGDLSQVGANLKNQSAPIQAVVNILNTRIGEDPFNRLFGCRIEDYLFEPFSFSISRLILSDAVASILRWESRVTILPETDVFMDMDTRTYAFTLYMTVSGFEGVIEHTELFQAKEAA